MSVRREDRRLRAKRGLASPVRPAGRLRAFKLGEGVPSIPQMVLEIQDMIDVLMGRNDPPVELGHMTMMEVADGYFARASELTMDLQRLEREGRIMRGSAHMKFRTGELRTFMEMAKRAADLGSRRLTAAQLQYEMEQFGRESKGGGR